MDFYFIWFYCKSCKKYKYINTDASVGMDAFLKDCTEAMCKDAYSTNPEVKTWQKLVETNTIHDILQKFDSFIENDKKLYFLAAFRKGVTSGVINALLGKLKMGKSVTDTKWSWLKRLLTPNLEIIDRNKFRKLLDVKKGTLTDFLADGSLENLSDDVLALQLAACKAEESLLNDLVVSRSTLLTLQSSIKTMREEAASRYVAAGALVQKLRPASGASFGGVKGTVEGVVEGAVSAVYVAADEDSSGVDTECTAGIRDLRTRIEAVVAKHSEIEAKIEALKSVAATARVEEKVPRIDLESKIKSMLHKSRK